jgi:oligoendopeptidase F
MKGWKSMAETNLPSRKSADKRWQWRLEDLYATNEDWEKEYMQADGMIPKAAAWEGRLGESPGALLQALEDIAALSLLVERLYCYAQMRRDEDNAESLYQGMTDRAVALSVRVSGALSFFDPELLAIDSEKLKGFFASEPRLAVHRHNIELVTRRREHTLSQPEEKLIAMAGEVMRGPDTIYTLFNNADLVFPVIRGEGGEEVRITHGRYIPLMESANRDVRQAAFKGMYSTYGGFKNTLASALAASVKADLFESRARKFGSTLEASLHADAVPVEVYDALIAAVRASLPALHRYMRLKKRALKLEELHMYDLYAPIVGDVEMKAKYAQACEMVAEGLAPLGSEYIDKMRKGLSSGWVDVYENKGKTSGAYSFGVWGTHPYVLMNWNDTLDNAFTLAHELGHAMHSFFSDRQPYVVAQYPILLAEVASTCNEALFMDYMLKHTSDRRKKLYLLSQSLENVRTTVIRQVMFAEFEKAIHAMAAGGEALTPESICAVYHSLNADYFGADVNLDEGIDMEWARVSHFYSSFYVYKYATGFSSAVAIAEMLLGGGAAERERYLALLAGGGTDYPLNLLRQAGVDLLKPDAVAACLGKFGKRIEEMESML